MRTGALLGSLTIPGRPECVHVAREFVAARLRDGYACADTAVLLTSELVTNSAVHSDSRRHGGTVTVTLIALPDGIRAEVIDEGGVTVPSLRAGPGRPDLSDTGRGLQLIEALSARWDYWSDEAGTVTWFELTEPAPRPSRRAGTHTLGGVENLIALVTGANKGIGIQIAHQLADAGLTVYVGSRDAARGERAVAEIGGDARLVVLDVTDAASIAAAARRVDALDILVNNAGISGDDQTADLEDTATFRRVYETNVLGVVAVTNAFLPALRRSAHPRVVNISSSTGSLTWATGPQFPHRGSYAAYRSSKTALNALTVFYAHALADECIKVNALAPGLRRTDLNATAAASDGDPAEAAAGAVRLALLPDDGPTGQFFSWDGTPVPW